MTQGVCKVDVKYIFELTINDVEVGAAHTGSAHPDQRLICIGECRLGNAIYGRQVTVLMKPYRTHFDDPPWMPLRPEGPVGSDAASGRGRPCWRRDPERRGRKHGFVATEPPVDRWGPR